MVNKYLKNFLILMTTDINDINWVREKSESKKQKKICLTLSERI